MWKYNRFHAKNLLYTISDTEAFAKYKSIMLCLNASSSDYNYEQNVCSP